MRELPADIVLQFLRQLTAPEDLCDLPDRELLQRFLTARDEASFAVLIRRHGPMVFRLAARVLRNEHDAEDVFQATFLALSRQGSKLRKFESLSSWLYGVAYRLALKAKSTSARRHARENRVAPVCPADPLAEITLREGQEILDQELAALPEKYRAPVILCCLQGLARDEAARQLAWPLATLKYRLERGRKGLRIRLAERGLTLSAALGALFLGEQVGTAAVPRLLFDSTIKAAALAAAGSAVASVVSARVAALTKGATKIMFPSIYKVASAMLLAAVGLVLAVLGQPVSSTSATAPPVNANNKGAPETAPRLDCFADPLPEGVIARLGTTRARAGIQSFGILADGTVVTVGANVAVRPWSPKSDQSDEPFLLPLADPNPYLYPQVSADGRFFAAGTESKVVVWERAGAAIKQVAEFKIKQAQRLAFSPDGGQLGVLSEEVEHLKKISLCKVRSGEVRTLPLEATAETLCAFCFSGDGQRLLTGFSMPEYGRALVWNTQTGKLLCDHKVEMQYARPSALDRTGDVIAILPYAWGEERLLFLNASTGKPVEGRTGPEVDGTRFINFGREGKTALIGGPNGIRWWDPTAGKLIRQFDAPSLLAVGFVRQQAQFTPNGKVLVSHTRQMLLRWDATTGQALFPQSQETGHTAAATAVGVSQDGNRVATAAGWEVGVRIWDAKSGQQLAVLPAGVSNQQNLEFSPDGRFLFTPNRNGDAVVKWNLATGKEAARYSSSTTKTNDSELQAYRLASDGRSIYAALTNSGTKMGSSRFVTWDVESGRILSQRQEDGLSSTIAPGLSPNGRWAMHGNLLFPIANGPRANILAGAESRGTSPGQVFSWDSRLFARTEVPGAGDVPGEKQTVRAIVLEVATGAKVCEMPVRWLANLAFHPDGRSLVVAEPDGLVFWDLTTGKEYARRKAHELHLDDPWPFAKVVRYFPDGKKLVTGHIDTSSLVWEVPDRPNRGIELTEKERTAAWNDLSSPDGSKGWAAVWALGVDPGAVAFLRERAKPVQALPVKEFEQLLTNLGSEDFATREAATETLGKAGESAVGQLVASLQNELMPEQKVRVEQILAVWKSADQGRASGDRLRTIRAVAAVELAGTPEARKLLDELAAGETAATSTREAKQALERIGR